MADNEEDLVSQIKVEGGEEAAAQVESFADRGAAAFDKLGAAAAGQSGKVRDAYGRVVSGAQDARKASQDLEKTASGSRFGINIGNQLKGLEGNISAFVGSIQKTTQAVGRFAGRIALIGSAAQAGAVAFALGAEKIAKAADGTDTSLKDQAKTQIDARNQALSLETAQINLAASNRKLMRDAQEGKITWSEYTKQVKENNKEFKEQQRVANEVAAATRRATEDNERLQKQVEKREAFNKLVDTLGGPLASSMVAFGRQVEATRRGFLEGFGPGLAALVDTIGKAFSDNAPKIQAFFDTMGAKLQAFVAQNGPAIQLALENIGSAASSIFEGLIAAGPPLLSFFNNQLVPAIKSIGSFFSGLATTLNSVFGTQFTGGFLILIGLLAQLSGGLRLFFSILKPGLNLLIGLGRILLIIIGGATPLGLAITALTIALGVLAAYDWTTFSTLAMAAFTQITTFFTNLQILTVSVFQTITDNLAAFVKMFTDFPANVTIIWNALWTALVESFKQFIANTVAEFDALIKFFTDFPANVQIIWNAAGQFLVDAFNAAVLKVKTFLKDLRDTAMEYLKPIVDLIKAILGTSGSVAGGGPPVTAAGGGHIRGRGTSTSDSIPAWLSNNEFVMRAKAVGKYGLGFMRAVNSGSFKMPKFNMGGLNVIGPRISAPAFADGGPARTGTSSLRPINLSILGQTFNGLLAPEDTAARLNQFAISKMSRSGGRKPQWKGT